MHRRGGAGVDEPAGNRDRLRAAIGEGHVERNDVILGGIGRFRDCEALRRLELARIGAAIEKPLLANMVEGGRTPIVSAKRLKEIGFDIAIYPILGLLAAAEAVRRAMRHLRDTGSSAGIEVPLYGQSTAGESIHELGTCRMGRDPKTSVLNRFNQSHDVKNLFVVDGSSFVSGGSQNPTLTILALSMRASEYLASEMQKGNL